jgi:extradiol dioxygenase family protein
MMTRMRLPPFHLAIMVSDLAAAREFYGGLLGCAEGRSADTWVDFDFHGHQLVCHLAPPGEGLDGARAHSNPVDGHDIPVPHFGLVLEMEEWDQLRERLNEKAVHFVIEPYVRFEGLPGEQATMFLLDPCGNALEFKAFSDIDSQLFAK